MEGHRLIKSDWPCWSVSYWKDGVASDQKKCTEATLEVGFGLDKIELSFNYPEEAGRLGEVILALRQSYENGQHDALKSVRQVLRIKETR